MVANYGKPSETAPPAIASRFKISQRLIIQSLLFCCLFPWVSFGLNNMDTQPWSFITALLAIVACIRNGFSHLEKTELAIILFLLFAASTSALISGVDDRMSPFLVTRSLISYSGFALYILLFCLVLRSNRIDVSMVVLLANGLYLLVGWTELIFDLDFSWLVDSRGGQVGRGVSSLTPEPSFYGLVLVILNFLFITQLLSLKNKPLLRRVIVINYLTILLVAQSLVAIIPAAVLLLIQVISSPRRLTILTFLGVAVGVIGILSLLLEADSSRLMRLTQLILDGGVVFLFTHDASANGRLASIVLPVIASIDNLLVPGGFVSFADAAREIQGSLSFFWHGVGNNKIMSFAGTYLYELGIFGWLLLMSFSLIVLFGTRSALYFFWFSVVIFFSFPPSSIFVAMVVSCASRSAFLPKRGT